MNTKLRSLLTVLSGIGIAATITGCRTFTARASQATPCMAVLGRFTADDVPAMGPGETESPAGKWTNEITPPNLPGNGLAQHPMFYVGENYDKMFLVKDGKVIWNNWKNLVDATAVQILDDPGIPENSGESEH